MDEAIIGLVWDANSVVSSANVAMVISVDTDKSLLLGQSRRTDVSRRSSSPGISE